MDIDVIEDLDRLRHLESDWRAVYKVDPEAQFFVSWDWMSSWLKHAIKQWFVLAARSDKDPSRYVAFFALRPTTEFKKGVGLRNGLTVACQAMASYSGLVCDPDEEESAIPALARCLQGMSWSVLNLESFDMSERRFDLFLKSFSPKNFKSTKTDLLEPQSGIDLGLSPCLTLPDSWETYVSEQLSSNTRQKVRRFLRKVDAADEFTITHADSATIERDLDIMLRLWGSMWDAQKGEQSEDIKKVNRIMLMQCFQQDALYLPVMWQGDRPLGALAIIVDPVKKSYLFKMTGRDQSFKGPPPGFVMHAHAIRHAIANGFRTYDFLLGNEPYKYLFGSQDRRLLNLAISTKNGRNLTGALDRRSLPSAVKLADKLRKAGQLGPAERAYRQILQADKAHRPALMGLVSVLQAKGDSKGAQRVMKALVESD